MNLHDTLVVLDTCVLLKPRLSDVLMDLRAEQLFSAHWSENIDDEFLRNMQNIYGVPQRLAEARLKAMKRRCPEWQVPMSCVDFNKVPEQVDEKDRHVAAAALALRYYAEQEGPEDGEVQVYLVTDNVRDMASRQMRTAGVKVMKPGAFLNLVYSEQPREAERAVLQSVQDLECPPYTKEEILWALKTQGANTMVGALAKSWDVVPVKKMLATHSALKKLQKEEIPLLPASAAPRKTRGMQPGLTPKPITTLPPKPTGKQ